MRPLAFTLAWLGGSANVYFEPDALWLDLGVGFLLALVLYLIFDALIDRNFADIVKRYVEYTRQLGRDQ